MDLDAFLASYIACALWSSTDEHGEPLDAVFSDQDISGGSFLKMREECEDFIDANREDLRGLDPAQAGHDLWLTRNSHGAGFWDRGVGARGDRLSAAARLMGEQRIYEGPGGFLYVG